MVKGWARLLIIYVFRYVHTCNGVLRYRLSLTSLMVVLLCTEERGHYHCLLYVLWVNEHGYHGYLGQLSMYTHTILKCALN